MRKIFVCSPFRGDTYVNIEKAKCYCRYVVNKKFLPICPHIYFTMFLDDSYTKERNIGINMGIQLLSECDEMWVFGDFISEGMNKEIESARQMSKKIKFIKHIKIKNKR